MADTKISALTELTDPVSGDWVPIVDVSDTTMAASGTTKKLDWGAISPSQPQVLEVGPDAEYATIADAVAYVAANSTPVDVTSAAAQLLTVTQSIASFNMDFSATLYDGNNVCAIPISDNVYIRIRNSGDTDWEALRKPAQYSPTGSRISCIAGREDANATARTFQVVEIPAFVISLSPGRHIVSTSVALPEICQVSFAGEGRNETVIEFTTTSSEILTSSQGSIRFTGCTLVAANGQSCVKFNSALTYDAAEFLTFTAEECTMIPSGDNVTEPMLDIRAGISYITDSKVAFGTVVNAIKILGATFKISDSEIKSSVLLQVLSLLVTTSPSQNRIIAASTFDNNLTIQSVSDRVGTVTDAGTGWPMEINGCTVNDLLLDGKFTCRSASMMVETVNTTVNNILRIGQMITSLGVYPTITADATSTITNLTQLSGGQNGLFVFSAAAQDIIGGAIMVDSSGAFTMLFDTSSVSAGMRFTVISKSSFTLTCRTDTDLIPSATGGQAGTRMVLTAGGLSDAFAMVINDAIEFLVVEDTLGDPVYLLETNRFNTGLN